MTHTHTLTHTTDQPHPRAKSLARSNVRDKPDNKKSPRPDTSQRGGGKINLYRVPFQNNQSCTGIAILAIRFVFRSSEIKKIKKDTLTAALDNYFQSRIHQRPDVARGETHAILPGIRLFQHPDGQSGIGYGRTHFHALDERSGRSRRRRRRRGRGGGDVAAALLLLLLRSSVESREQSHRRVGGAGPGGSASGDAAAMVIVVATRRVMRRRRQVEPRGRIDGGGEEDDDNDDRRDDSHYF